MPILLDFVWVVLGLVLLYFGAEWLVKGAGEIALKIGISPLVVGLTVVAFGTSAPELLVSVAANLQDPPKGDIALGNVVGSNICNLALVLGIGALMRPLSIHGQVIKREMPILLFATAIFWLMLGDGSISRIEGMILASGVILYTVLSIWLGKRGEEMDIDLDLSEAEIEKLKEAGAGQIAKDILLVLIGLGGLAIGANRLVEGGGNIAAAFGVPDAVIALTLVAFGTSLPEVATTVVASLKGEGDLATGNAVGSCIFNLLAVVGFSGAIAPLSALQLQQADLMTMAGITVVSYLFFLSRRMLSRWEGGLLLAAYLAYTVWLFFRQG
ncbi:MAG: calcium/sodium antiporter [Verrucomicrobiota bacterium JB023]|nr:calcium/sodium antiporter [Verrucomicrobiota bacterium JB023]